MSRQVMVGVAQDLLKGDECKQVLQVMEEVAILTEKQLQLKDSVIDMRDKEINSQNKIIITQDHKYQVKENECTSLRKQLRKAKRRAVVTTVVSGVVCVAGIVLVSSVTN